MLRFNICGVHRRAQICRITSTGILLFAELRFVLLAASKCDVRGCHFLLVPRALSARYLIPSSKATKTCAKLGTSM